MPATMLSSYPSGFSRRASKKNLIHLWMGLKGLQQVGVARLPRERHALVSLFVLMAPYGLKTGLKEGDCPWLAPAMRLRR